MVVSAESTYIDLLKAIYLFTTTSLVSSLSDLAVFTRLLYSQVSGLQDAALEACLPLRSLVPNSSPVYRLGIPALKTCIQHRLMDCIKTESLKARCDLMTMLKDPWLTNFTRAPTLFRITFLPHLTLFGHKHDAKDFARHFMSLYHRCSYRDGIPERAMQESATRYQEPKRLQVGV